MKNPSFSKFRSVALSAVVLLGCSGSTTTGGSGAAAGASGSAGEAAGGSSAGGTTSSGGSAHGGSAHGGSSSGGASMGGSSNGGASVGGASMGGTGASTQCSTDGDCTACAYPTAPQQPSDCYCASCPSTPLSKAACMANQAAWTKECSATPRPCPAIACIRPPIPACMNQMCVAAGGALP